MRRGPAFTRDRRGVAAVEFALLAPVLIVIAMSLSDVTNAVIAWWQLASASDAIARITTNFAATTTNSNSISTPRVATASTAVFALMPALATGPASLYGVTISSVVMTPTVQACTVGCVYVAHTAWSIAARGSAVARPCGLLGAAPDGAPASSTTLPTDAFTAAPMLVVDVTYDFTPIFTTLFGAGLHLMQSAYLAARTGGNADWVHLTGPNAAAAQCPGYIP